MLDRTRNYQTLSRVDVDGCKYEQDGTRYCGDGSPVLAEEPETQEPVNEAEEFFTSDVEVIETNEYPESEPDPIPPQKNENYKKEFHRTLRTHDD